jgi:hypothetical protein
MILKIKNKNDFVDKFLSPISKINENAVIKVNTDKITSLITTNDETLILYVVYADESTETLQCNLNIPDINRLIKVFNCIDDDNINIELDSNRLRYTSDNINFKYHLLEDGILTTPSVSFDKIKQLNFTTNFDIKSHDISALIKASTFTVDTDKLYVYTNNGKVYCELTDKQKHNIDSFSRVLADNYTGDEILTSIPLNFETFRLMSSLRFEQCSVCLDPDKKVFLITINSGDFTLNFVTVGLVG